MGGTSLWSISKMGRISLGSTREDEGNFIGVYKIGGGNIIGTCHSRNSWPRFLPQLLTFPRITATFVFYANFRDFLNKNGSFLKNCKKIAIFLLKIAKKCNFFQKFPNDNCLTMIFLKFQIPKKNISIFFY